MAIHYISASWDSESQSIFVVPSSLDYVEAGDTVEFSGGLGVIFQVPTGMILLVLQGAQRRLSLQCQQELVRLSKSHLGMLLRTFPFTLTLKMKL